MKNQYFVRGLQVTAVSMLMAATSQSYAGDFSQSNLPTEVQVPAGNIVAMHTSAKGNITWECKTGEQNMKEARWAFAGPVPRYFE